MSRAKSRRSPITGAIVVADVILADGDCASRSDEIRKAILADCQASLASHKVPAVIRFVPSLDVTAAGSWPEPMHNVLVTGGSRGIGLAIAHRLAGAAIT